MTPSKSICNVATLIERYFTERLMRQRNVSANTIASYRDTLLKVTRNKGAPGVDGQTVEEAQHNARPSVPMMVRHRSPESLALRA
jgi:site-specific recombinase XerD